MPHFAERNFRRTPHAQDTFIFTGLLSAAALGFAGCDVEKTREGSVELPRYEVNKTKEGEIAPPKYDVDPADVKISQTQKEVTVPKIHTEKETITVPKIEVTPAPPRESDNR